MDVLRLAHQPSEAWAGGGVDHAGGLVHVSPHGARAVLYLGRGEGVDCASHILRWGAAQVSSPLTQDVILPVAANGDA